MRFGPMTSPVVEERAEAMYLADTRDYNNGAGDGPWRRLPAQCKRRYRVMAEAITGE